MELHAVIDVGTNSVKILLAQVSGTAVEPIWETSRQTRLGQGFYEDHRLRPEPIAATAAATAEFCQEARRRGAQSIRVIATSAAREAVNQSELIEAIQRASGLVTEVIPGEQEADWAFRGVTSDPAYTTRRLLILDVGGGSTEFILGHHGHAAFGQSFPLGSVRWFERYRPSDPPSATDLAVVRQSIREFLETVVRPRLQPHFDAAGGVDLAVGVGGTSSLLALIYHQVRSFDRQLIERTRFSRTTLRQLHEQLWSLPLARRRELPGLPPERADVILTGTAIYEGVLEAFSIAELGMSTRGLRYAALTTPTRLDVQETPKSTGASST